MLFKRIKELRLEHHLTQAAAAQKLNINREVYRRYETGIRDIPVDILIHMAKGYRTSTDYILGLTDDKYPAQGVAVSGR